jgi:hypothetical protein
MIIKVLVIPGQIPPSSSESTSNKRVAKLLLKRYNTDYTNKQISTEAHKDNLDLFPETDSVEMLTDPYEYVDFYSSNNY